MDRVVAARAIETPDAVAVRSGNDRTTYRELMDAASAVACNLREIGVLQGDRVGMCSDTSPELIAAIMGIWAAGATYVPLDPGQPHARLETIARDAEIRYCLTDAANADRVLSCEVLSLAALAKAAPGDRADGWTSDARPDHIAYVVYTSGSTGAPKGVEIRHDGVVNAILASCEISGFVPEDIAVVRTAIGFDLSFYEIFCPLTAGAALIVVPRAVYADPFELVTLLAVRDVTVLLVTPAFLSVLIAEPRFNRCTALRIVTAGGEALSSALCKRFAERSTATLYNLYGPSEATMLVTLHRCSEADALTGENTAPLGHALANNCVSLRDESLQPVARGEIGEIVIAGVQLAKGYINRPDETAKRFVDDPARPGERIYRTGDLARLMPDGNIVFLGRNDKQVKIRGNRVEPAEVAAAIERIPGVRTAAVLAKRRTLEGNDESLMLVAYVMTNDGHSLAHDRLRAVLGERVPSYMIPNETIAVAAFPLTVSGKIDEAALARGAFGRISDSAAISVINETPTLHGIVNEQVRAVWERLLGLERVGDHDDFFDIGGDSLLAVHLLMELEELFGRRIALEDFFESMTIASLGNLLASGSNSDERDAIALNEDGTLPPLVYLHGDFAGGAYAWSLAKLLGEEQPVTIVPPHGMRGRPPASDVPSMATDVVETITRVHPAGPLCIGGYSAAGLVAYEVARRLREAGREVRDVILIGTHVPSVAYSGLDRAIRGTGVDEKRHDRILRKAMRAGFALERFARSSARARWMKLARRLGLAAAETSGAPAPNEIELSDGYARYIRAHEAFIPSSYDGDVAVLWPAEQRIENGDLHRDWSRVAAAVEFASIPGTHHGCVSRHLTDIAAIIRKRALCGQRVVISKVA